MPAPEPWFFLVFNFVIVFGSLLTTRRKGNGQSEGKALSRLARTCTYLIGGGGPVALIEHAIHRAQGVLGMKIIKMNDGFDCHWPMSLFGPDDPSYILLSGKRLVWYWKRFQNNKVLELLCD
jgi:hypothetical protein